MIFIMFDLVSLFNSISTFVGYLMPKSSLEKNGNDTIQPILGVLLLLFYSLWVFLSWVSW